MVAGCVHVVHRVSRRCIGAFDSDIGAEFMMPRKKRNEVPEPKEKVGLLDYTWYLIKLPIWYLIKDNDCPYCIFLRGVTLGLILMGVAWLMFQ